MKPARSSAIYSPKYLFDSTFFRLFSSLPEWTYKYNPISVVCYSTSVSYIPVDFRMIRAGTVKPAFVSVECQCCAMGFIRPILTFI